MPLTLALLYALPTALAIFIRRKARLAHRVPIIDHARIDRPIVFGVTPDRIDHDVIERWAAVLVMHHLGSKRAPLLIGQAPELVLEDDRHYFPPYEAVFLTRQDALTRVPALAEVLRKLGGSISTEEMRKLNYEVDGLKRDKKVVVREWLVKKGFV